MTIPENDNRMPVSPSEVGDYASTQLYKHPEPVGLGDESSWDYAWVCERGSAPEYVTCTNAGFAWTSDNRRALRFARRADAEMVALVVEDIERIVEHGWYKNALSAPRAAEVVAPVCWRCKKAPGVVYDGMCHECVACAGESAKSTRAILNGISNAVCEGLASWPRMADRVEFVRYCVQAHREDAARRSAGG